MWCFDAKETTETPGVYSWQIGGSKRGVSVGKGPGLTPSHLLEKLPKRAHHRLANHSILPYHQGQTRNIMADGQLFKPEKDYTKEVDKQLPEAEELAKDNVQAALEKLSALEKHTRQVRDLQDIINVPR